MLINKNIKANVPERQPDTIDRKTQKISNKRSKTKFEFLSIDIIHKEININRWIDTVFMVNITNGLKTTLNIYIQIIKVNVIIAGCHNFILEINNNIGKKMLLHKELDVCKLSNIYK